MRDRIGGTDALEGDFDRWKLAERYDPAYEGIERLGDFVAHRLKLTAKPALEVPLREKGVARPWPVVHSAARHGPQTIVDCPLPRGGL